jgi:hypothetical protein
MAATHGDLYSEIGKLVLAAHAGQAIDLTEKSEELARRYINLGVPAETIARAIARSLGAVGLSLSMIRRAEAPSQANGHSRANGHGGEDAGDRDDEGARSPAALFPSGVRVAVLS